MFFFRVPAARRAAGLVAVAAAVALSQGCSSAAPDRESGAAPVTTGPAAGASATPTGPAGPAAILGGERQVAIASTDQPGQALAVDSEGRLDFVNGPSDYRLFVLTPVGERHMISTAQTAPSGDVLCMGLQSNARLSLTVVAKPCDPASTHQLFTITESVAGDQTYTIMGNGSIFLRPSNDNHLIAEEVGDDPGAATFTFTDNGPATATPDR